MPEERSTLGILESHRASRALGEHVAKLVQLPLVDATDGEEVVRQHDELDASMREQATTRGATVSLPDPPPNTRSTVRMEGEQVVVDIPAIRMQRIHYLIPAVMLLPAIAFSIFFVMWFDTIPLAVRIAALVVFIAGPLVGAALSSA